MSTRELSNRAFISMNWSRSDVPAELGGATEAEEEEPAGEADHRSPYMAQGSSARVAPDTFMTGLDSSSNSAGKHRGPDGTKPLAVGVICVTARTGNPPGGTNHSSYSSSSPSSIQSRPLNSLLSSSKWHSNV